MKKFVVSVLFFTGANKSYDKVVYKEVVVAENEHIAIDIVKEHYSPKITEQFLLNNCTAELLIQNKYKKEFMYRAKELCELTDVE